ncbi:rRNA N(6)-adenosine-methyltransferase ZCCHC4 isoform X3 [Notamacropus eugenii]|uniref:rRNA N(6)-adenosine-methyltransferase ZCCHC4 isoform X3 n=1 Tax=Notamacropus eugenii TaxID=9315 RepID=UPI003B6830D7
MGEGGWRGLRCQPPHPHPHPAGPCSCRAGQGASPGEAFPPRASSQRFYGVVSRRQHQCAQRQLWCARLGNQEKTEGPTLLFVKVNQGKEEARRFYACSACRDRKDCNFFQWEDEKLSEARLAAREIYNRRCQPPLSHKQYVERYLKFIELPLSQRKFCQRCQQLLLPDDWGKHCDHQVLCDISSAQLKRPSQLLYPLENKKTNAQYLFTDRSCQFLLDLISTLGFRKVLCVGTPRLHELIRLKASGDKESDVKSLLLDIDFRYSQFYTEESFCHYNMFNHHFFDGQAALEICRKFLQEDKGAGLILVTDPPFGGLVKSLAITFRKFMDMWKEEQSPDNNSKELPLFWIFPYFFESRILQFFPSFSMLDYQVLKDMGRYVQELWLVLERWPSHMNGGVFIPVLQESQYHSLPCPNMVGKGASSITSHAPVNSPGWAYSLHSQIPE